MTFRHLAQLDDFWAEHPEYQGVPKEYGEYAISFANVQAASINNRASFTVDRKADFVMTAGSAITTLVNNQAYGVNQALLVTFINEARAINLNNVQLDIATMIGAQYGSATPNSLPERQFAWPIIIPAGTKFTALLDNPGNQVLNITISFDGVKVFNQQQSPGGRA